MKTDWRIVPALCALALCASVACADPLPGSLPLRRDAEPAQERSAWMPSLLLLCVAAGAGGYALWRRGRGVHGASALRRGEASVTRLSSHALTPHASVHAVQWRGEEFLLACTSQQVAVLARRPVGASEGDTR